MKVRKKGYSMKMKKTIIALIALLITASMALSSCMTLAPANGNAGQTDETGSGYVFSQDTDKNKALNDLYREIYSSATYSALKNAWQKAGDILKSSETVDLPVLYGDSGEIQRPYRALKRFAKLFEKAEGSPLEILDDSIRVDCRSEYPIPAAQYIIFMSLLIEENGRYCGVFDPVVEHYVAEHYLELNFVPDTQSLTFYFAIDLDSIGAESYTEAILISKYCVKADANDYDLPLDEFREKYDWADVLCKAGWSGAVEKIRSGVAAPENVISGGTVASIASGAFNVTITNRALNFGISIDFLSDNPFESKPNLGLCPTEYIG
ncbi:MAG: hypothetical protein IJU75_02815 [Clostridia bacterium]|nr:hypothetical protein [Clostridia bacterium]